MTLLGLLGRALAVSLLFGVMLLPAADHHAGGRLPGGPSSTVHRELTHHHGADDHPTDVAPLVLPFGGGALGVAIPSPFASAIEPLPPPTLLSRPVTAAEAAPPTDLAEPPPVPPPILPA